MTRVFDEETIRAAVDPTAVVDAVAEGLRRYSAGEVDVPPVGLLHFEDPPGDVHIKYGAIRGDDYYLVRVASGFYENVLRDTIVELGAIVADPSLGRTSPDQITVADLTGVAVQDIQVAKMAWETLVVCR